MLEKIDLKEKVTHGEKSFPLCVYHSKSDTNHFIGYHWHNEVEFFYLNKGNVIVSVDSAPIEVHAGEAVFVNSGQIHSGHLHYSTDCEFYAIVFNLNMLSSNTIGDCQNRYINTLMNKKYGLPQKYSKTSDWEIDILKQLKQIIHNYLNKVPGYEMAITGSLYTIISQLIIHNKLIISNHARDEGLHNYKRENFKKVLNYIHTNYPNKIGLVDMANEINMSQYHFCRFFKSMSGQTPFAYLNDCRINQAVLLLCNSDRKVMDIAFDVGFTNFSYFIKIFKQIKGCTPSKFVMLKGI
ncbi:AraC family transcriptional regulator [Pelosinus sp. IPA-1]|uniref:AraC family transcriptional regulator n=1 Tax=Pelosinus sp. IPA-1 TaxID=3029569 RepID=UPI002436274C|nr:AraC family transcriptional regulator [Pelosinus sp. IPA-1]GMB01142.1 AraC family transcriptional regulator [Pelosinus sp. IPA-1]